jgi:flagellar basal-body rod modification protein FlgD
MTSPIGSTSGTTATGATAPKTAPTANAGDQMKLSSDAFLKLLVAQLQYQDPSKPVDTSAFMQETATLTQVQSMESNAKAQSDMLTAQRAQTAASFVGKTVKYTALDGTQATGVVSSALITGTMPALTIGGVSVDLSKVTEILSTPA